jgi:hypothetical protein
MVRQSPALVRGHGGHFPTLIERFAESSWLRNQNEAHTYNVVAPYVLVDEKRMMGLPDTVKFVSSQPELLPLPDPRLLKIHAACAEVAYLSGAAEYIDEVIDGMDEGATNVLAEDGSSYALEIAFARRADIAVC